MNKKQTEELIANALAALTKNKDSIIALKTAVQLWDKVINDTTFVMGKYKDNYGKTEMAKLLMDLQIDEQSKADLYKYFVGGDTQSD